MSKTHDTEYTSIIMIPGYWLGSWAWDAVAARLRARGWDAQGVTLPGLESVNAPRASVHFADHVSRVTDLIGSRTAQSDSGDKVVLVGHSGGGAVASAVADLMPDRIARIIYVDSGPVSDGTVPRPDIAPEDVELPFPGLENLSRSGASTEGLDEYERSRFERCAVPHPAGAVRDRIALHDPRRNEIPTTTVCCSVPSARVRDLVAAHAPMFSPLNDLTDLTFTDLPTGHWPMFSRPTELADLIDRESSRHRS
jgi:pimeloyl-ACP methyl ester carboxylesterase